MSDTKNILTIINDIDLKKIRSAKYFISDAILTLAPRLNTIPKNTNPVWRTLALLRTQCNLEFGLYKVMDTSIAVSPTHDIIEQKQIPSYRVEVFTNIEKFPNIKEAHIHAEGVLIEFINRITITAYSQTFLRLISTCQDVIAIDTPFDLVIPYLQPHRSPLPIITPTDIEQFNDSLSFVRSQIRKALNSTTLEDRFLNTYIALERIAESETTETTKDKIKCEKCGHIGEKDTGRKKLGQYIQSLLADDEANEEIIKEVVKIRNKIAHGGGDRNTEFLKQLALNIKTIESTALGIVAERSSAVIRYPEQAIAILPFSKFSCKYQPDGFFSILEFDYKIDITLSEVKKAVNVASNLQNATRHNGIWFGPDSEGFFEIEADAWPNNIISSPIKP